MSVLCAEFNVYHLTNLRQGGGLMFLCENDFLRGKLDLYIIFRIQQSKN